VLWTLISPGVRGADAARGSDPDPGSDTLRLWTDADVYTLYEPLQPGITVKEVTTVVDAVGSSPRSLCTRITRRLTTTPFQASTGWRTGTWPRGWRRARDSSWSWRFFKVRKELDLFEVVAAVAKLEG
jgi:hypothetical protein